MQLITEVLIESTGNGFLCFVYASGGVVSTEPPTCILALDELYMGTCSLILVLYGHANEMIVKYRQRAEDRQKHIELEWEEGGCILKNVKYFPQWGKVYSGKAQNWRTKHWYTLYTISEELNERILNACIEKFGKNEVIPPEMGQQAKLIEFEVEINGVWRDEASCKLVTKRPIKEWAELNKFNIRQKG